MVVYLTPTPVAAGDWVHKRGIEVVLEIHLEQKDHLLIHFQLGLANVTESCPFFLHLVLKTEEISSPAHKIRLSINL